MNSLERIQVLTDGFDGIRTQLLTHMLLYKVRWYFNVSSFRNSAIFEQQTIIFY